MADLFLLSQVQMRRIERYFPLSHGIARVDDRRIVSAAAARLHPDNTGRQLLRLYVDSSRRLRANCGHSYSGWQWLNST
jgi:hypothetical protein